MSAPVPQWIVHARASGMTGLGAANTSDVLRQRAVSAAKVATVKERQRAETAQAKIAGDSSRRTAAWVPIAIVGGVIAVGIVAFVLMRKRGGR